MKTKQNTLSSYLTITVGAGCAISSANAAVTIFGQGATPPAGIDFGVGTFGGFAVNSTQDTNFQIGVNVGANFFYTYFTQGSDLITTDVYLLGSYVSGTYGYGAVIGSNNYALVSFDGDDILESVAQFSFDNAGGGFLVAVAANPAGNVEYSISEGKIAIDAVPEPSSLALLALGATGLAARRRRKAA